MADTIEIRLDQLTQAIKGLYAKSSMSQGEIYNTLTNLSQRYENLTNASNEKIASLLVNEFRKTLDTKYAQTNDYLKELEENLRKFMDQVQSPKMADEIAKLLTDTGNIYTRLNSQDLAMQKIFDAVETQNRNSCDPDEILKLSKNFAEFSRGFESITSTLNKNFAEFLNQLQSANTKEQVTALGSEINTISGNINSIISAISVIDSKYKDLTGLISTVQQRENIFNDALREVRTLNASVASMKEAINSVDSKSELQALSAEIRNQIETVRYEIQKIINTSSDNEFKTEVYNLSGNVNSIQNNVSSINSSMSLTKDEVKNLAIGFNILGDEVKNVKKLLNDEILYKSHQNDENFQKYLSTFKEDIKTFVGGLKTFKEDLNSINSGNIKLLQEPIEKAIEDLKNKDIGRSIRELSDNLNSVTNQIQVSIQNLQNNVNDMNSVSSMQLLTEISQNIPLIQEKLEMFRNHVVAENSASLGEAKTTFAQSIADIQNQFAICADRIQQEVRSINIDTLDSFKVDLQKLSDSITDSVDSINSKVEQELSNFKSDIQDSSFKATDSIERVGEKISNLELGIENLTQDTIEKVTDILNTNNATSQDTINEVKSDILEGINEIEKSNKASLSQFETKIDKVLDSYIGADFDNITERKSLREAVVDIETKIDRTNLQQIHNAKELLEEIQSTSQNLNLKLSTIEESKNITVLIGAVSKIAEKIQSIEEFNTELAGEFVDLKEDLEIKLKENIHKISALIQNSQTTNENNPLSIDTQDISNKIQEYLNNFEYVKNNISQEIKESLDSEFQKIEQDLKETISTLTSDFSEKMSKVEDNVTSNFNKFNDKFEENIDKLNHKISATMGKMEESLGRGIDKFNLEISSNASKTQEKLETISTSINSIQNKFEQDINEKLLKLENALKRISSQDENSNYSYTLEDIESDLAKVCLSIEKNIASADDFKTLSDNFKTLSDKTNELKALGIENVKLHHELEGELNQVGAWIKDVVSKIEDVNQTIYELKSNGFEDIKTRLLQSEKSKNNISEFTMKIERAFNTIIKNAKHQDEKIDELSRKIETLAQGQTESFNPNQFIDIFYDNMTQTKMLSNRIEIVEDKINSLQNSVEKLISYVEQ